MWKWPDSSYAFELLVRQESDQVLRKAHRALAKPRTLLAASTPQVSIFTSVFDWASSMNLFTSSPSSTTVLRLRSATRSFRMQQIRGAVERGAHTWRLEWRA